MGKGGGEQTLRQRLHVAQLLFKGGAQGVGFGELRFQAGDDVALCVYRNHRNCQIANDGLTDVWLRAAGAKE